MARLVVLTEGYTGRAYELKAEKTTIGRVEDNAFQIPDPSVSSHHCEIILQGEQILVRDLNSTNGSFIGGEQITESVLKPGQVLRLGQVDVRLESAPPPASSGKKVIDKTQIIPQGVKMNDLETSGQTVIINKETFKGKSNKANKITIAIGVVLAIVIIVFIVIAISIVSKPTAAPSGGGAPPPPAETAK